MDKIVQKLILPSLLLMVVVPSAAQSSGDIWTNDFDILSLHVSSTGYIQVYGGDDLRLVNGSRVHTAAGCGVFNSMRTTVGAGEAAKARMHSMLMSAFLAGRQVRLLVSGQECGVGNYPAFWVIRIS